MRSACPQRLSVLTGSDKISYWIIDVFIILKVFIQLIVLAPSLKIRNRIKEFQVTKIECLSKSLNIKSPGNYMLLKMYHVADDSCISYDKTTLCKAGLILMISFSKTFLFY